MDSMSVSLLGLLLVALLVGGWVLALRRTAQVRGRALSDEQRRLSTLLDTLPDLVWLKGLDGRYLAGNTMFERFAGVPPGGVVGRPDTELFGAEVAAQFAVTDRQALATNQPTTNERLLQFKDRSSQGRYEVIKTPMRDTAGGVVGVLGIARDVTQHRLAQGRLQRLNQLYAVINGVSDTMAQLADAGQAQALFEATCRILVDQGGLRLAWIGAPAPAPMAAGAPAGPLQMLASAGQHGGWLHLLRSAMDRAAESPDPDALAGLGAAGLAWRDGSSVVHADLGADASPPAWQAAARQQGVAASAALTIPRRGGPGAVLAVYAGSADQFDVDEMRLLERLAVQLGRALDASDTEHARSQAEGELRDSESRFAQMFRTSPVGMALGRLSDGRFVDVNDSWLQMFGRIRAQVIGSDGLALDLWQDPAQRQVVTQRLLSDERLLNLDARMCRSDGQVLDISFSANRINIRGEPFLLSSFIDVTLRRRAEQALTEQTEQLEALVAQRTAELSGVFEALPDLYFRLDRDGIIRDCRAGQQADLVMPAHEQIGLPVTQVLAGSAGLQVLGGIRQVLASGQPATVEYALLLAVGEVFFETRLMPFTGDEVIAVVRNISQRRKLEQASEAARLEAESLSRLRSAFLANMSHEIRTPLNGIMGFAQIGLRQAEGSALLQASFGRILDASRLLLGIVNDVLDFSKIDAGQLSVESLPLDPREPLCEAVDMVRPAAEDKGLVLTVELAGDLPQKCLGDPLRLRQILLNLLSNAVKFTHQGMVQVWAGRDQDWLLVRVTDTGIGVDDDTLQQLFQPFQQADSSTTRRFGGTGLGLSISRRLARLMAGEITATSSPGQGSCFELRLPLQLLPTPPVAAAPAPAPRWAPPPDHQRLAGISLLVAEDNPVNQMVIESVLMAEGAEVHLVDNGALAVAHVAADPDRRLDLVLMDLQMPVMDGYAATAQIRQLAPGLPVIGQTAHALAEERNRCLAAGMVDHVAKPIDLEVLVALILRHARRPAVAATGR